MIAIVCPFRLSNKEDNVFEIISEFFGNIFFKKVTLKIEFLHETLSFVSEIIEIDFRKYIFFIL